MTKLIRIVPVAPTPSTAPVVHRVLLNVRLGPNGLEFLPATHLPEDDWPVIPAPPKPIHIDDEWLLVDGALVPVQRYRQLQEDCKQWQETERFNRRKREAIQQRNLLVVNIPEWVVRLYREQWAKRGPTGDFDPWTASIEVVALRACWLPAVVRGKGRRKALKWGSDWLAQGCPGVALPPPRKHWRAARIGQSGGIAVYLSDQDRAILWTCPPPWPLPDVDPFEPVWYAKAECALQEAQ